MSRLLNILLAAGIIGLHAFRITRVNVWPHVRDLRVRYLLIDVQDAAPELLAEGVILRGQGLRQLYAKGRVTPLEVLQR